MSYPYSFVWANVAAGTYTISAKATDNSGLTTTATTTFTLNMPPTVNLTSPLANAVYAAVPATVNITANAADANGTISKVSFYNGSTKLGEDLTAPYTFSWTGVAAGTYALRAIAYDNHGTSTTSATVSIRVGTALGLMANDDSSNSMSDLTKMEENTEGVSDMTLVAKNQNQVTLYPNPARNKAFLQLKVAQSGVYTVEIVNSIGQQVFVQKWTLQKGMNQQTIDVANFREGMYWVKVENSEQVLRTLKLVIR